MSQFPDNEGERAPVSADDDTSTDTDTNIWRSALHRPRQHPIPALDGSPRLTPSIGNAYQALRICPVVLTHINAFARAGAHQKNEYTVKFQEICRFVPEKLFLSTAAIKVSWLLGYVPILRQAKQMTLVPHCSSLRSHGIDTSVTPPDREEAYAQPATARALSSWIGELREGMSAGCIIRCYPPLMASRFGCQHTKLLLFTHNAETTTHSTWSSATKRFSQRVESSNGRTSLDDTLGVTSPLCHGSQSTPRSTQTSPAWLRVVVGTANMLANEICDKNQAHWVHDAPTLTLARHRAELWRQKIMGQGIQVRVGAEVCDANWLSPVAPPPKLAVPTALSPLVLAALNAAARALVTGIEALVAWQHSTDQASVIQNSATHIESDSMEGEGHQGHQVPLAVTDSPALTSISTYDLAQAPLHVRALVGTCSRLWQQCLTDALVLSQALLHRDLSSLLQSMSDRAAADVGGGMLDDYDMLSAGAALIPTCPLATSSAFATHGLARLHSLLASAQTARDSALCAPGRARSQWWLGDEEAISAARDALAAADGAEGPTVASATTGKTTDSSLSSAAWVSPAAMDTHSSATIFANRPGGDALASPNSSMSDATPSAMIQEGSPKYGSSSVTSARCAHAALDFLTGARAFSAPAHPRPTPIAQASSIGSPFAWLPAVIAGLNAHLWSRPGASHVSQQRCGTGGIGHAKESVPAGETRDSVATTKKKIDRSRRAAAGPRRLPLHIVWPSLQQVLKSIEGRYVRFARRHIVFFPGAEYKAGGWLLLQGGTHLSPALWSTLCRWADWGGRERAMPHIKSYCQPLRETVVADEDANVGHTATSALQQGNKAAAVPHSRATKSQRRALLLRQLAAAIWRDVSAAFERHERDSGVAGTSQSNPGLGGTAKQDLDTWLTDRLRDAAAEQGYVLSTARSTELMRELRESAESPTAATTAVAGSGAVATAANGGIETVSIKGTGRKRTRGNIGGSIFGAASASGKLAAPDVALSGEDIPLEWAVVSSANLSQPAWGALKPLPPHARAAIIAMEQGAGTPVSIPHVAAAAASTHVSHSSAPAVPSQAAPHRAAQPLTWPATQGRSSASTDATAAELACALRATRRVLGDGYWRLMDGEYHQKMRAVYFDQRNEGEGDGDVVKPLSTSNDENRSQNSHDHSRMSGSTSSVTSSEPVSVAASPTSVPTSGSVTPRKLPGALYRRDRKHQAVGATSTSSSSTSEGIGAARGHAGRISGAAALQLARAMLVKVKEAGVVLGNRLIPESLIVQRHRGRDLPRSEFAEMTDGVQVSSGGVTHDSRSDTSSNILRHCDLLWSPEGTRLRLLAYNSLSSRSCHQPLRAGMALLEALCTQNAQAAEQERLLTSSGSHGYSASPGATLADVMRAEQARYLNKKAASCSETSQSVDMKYYTESSIAGALPAAAADVKSAASMGADVFAALVALFGNVYPHEVREAVQLLVLGNTPSKTWENLDSSDGVDTSTATDSEADNATEAPPSPLAQRAQWLRTGLISMGHFEAGVCVTPALTAALLRMCARGHMPVAAVCCNNDYVRSWREWSGGVAGIKDENDATRVQGGNDPASESGDVSNADLSDICCDAGEKKQTLSEECRVPVCVPISPSTTADSTRKQSSSLLTSSDSSKTIPSLQNSLCGHLACIRGEAVLHGITARRVRRWLAAAQCPPTLALPLHCLPVLCAAAAADIDVSVVQPHASKPGCGLVTSSESAVRALEEGTLGVCETETRSGRDVHLTEVSEEEFSSLDARSLVNGGDAQRVSGSEAAAPTQPGSEKAFIDQPHLASAPPAPDVIDALGRVHVCVDVPLPYSLQSQFYQSSAHAMSADTESRMVLMPRQVGIEKADGPWMSEYMRE